MSRPVRGAWIETRAEAFGCVSAASRVPYGARGLKHGKQEGICGGCESRPVRGAWIETLDISFT